MQIHARYGDTDLNLIKIGAYGTPPSWLDIHMDPESAVRAAAAEHAQVVTPRVGEVVEVGQPFTNVEWYQPAR